MDYYSLPQMNFSRPHVVRRNEGKSNTWGNWDEGGFGARTYKSTPRGTL